MLPENIPAPIRTSTENDFAHRTMAGRLAGIAATVAERFSGASRDALHTLSQNVKTNAPLHMIDLPAPDYDEWAMAFLLHQGDTWLDTEWYFAEALLYRHILQASRWWELGRDPFREDKQSEINSSALWELIENAVTETELHTLLDLALWGNRLDLSYHASLDLGMADIDDEDRLVDERPAIIEHLHNLPTAGQVHLITDNFGTELAMDLMLLHHLLVNTSATFYIHTKLHPTYVSDATADDVRWLIAEMRSPNRPDVVQKAGHTLHNALDTGKIRLAPDWFWNSPYFFDRMPPRIEKMMSGAHITFLKGDANYRRLLFDAMWEPTTPFTTVAAYFPSPLVCLRTLKSDPIIGLPDGMVSRLAQQDDQWRVNGKRGVIQFKP